MERIALRRSNNGKTEGEREKERERERDLRTDGNCYMDRWSN